MNEIIKKGKDYIGYEYKEVTVSRDMEGVYADGYPHFGWTLNGGSDSPFGLSVVNMKFKRDRKIRNKAELTRLQRQFDSNVKEIERLEQSKNTKAFVTSLTVGLIGTALLAGATFIFIYAHIIPLMIVLAVPGFICWFLPYQLFRKIQAKVSASIMPLIEQQYDAIYNVCGQGHTLVTE